MVRDEGASNCTPQRSHWPKPSNERLPLPTSESPRPPSNACGDPHNPGWGRACIKEGINRLTSSLGGELSLRDLGALDMTRLISIAAEWSTIASANEGRNANNKTICACSLRRHRKHDVCMCSMPERGSVGHLANLVYKAGMES